MPHSDRFQGEGLLFNLSPRSRRATNARLAHNAEFQAEEDRLKQAQSDREGGLPALIRSSEALSGSFAGDAAQTPAAQGLLQALASADPAARNIGGVTVGNIEARTPSLQAGQESQQRALNIAATSLANRKAQLELDNAQRAGPTLPDRITIPVLDPGSGTITQRTVDSPSSNAYGGTLLQIEESFRGVGSMQALKELVGQPEGTEFFGSTADQMDAHYANAILGYAQAKGMGALQAPDLAIAERVVPNPASLGSNISGTLRSTVGLADSAVGFFTGQADGFIGFGRQDQIRGMQRRLDVATDDIFDNIIRAIARNPALLQDMSDADLARIPPDIAAPIIPYLQAMGRDPWR